MPNIAKVLREEVTRLARKEAKRAAAPIRRSNIQLKRKVRDLRSTLARLEKDSKGLAASVRQLQEQPRGVPDQAEKVRITAKGMRSLRRKLRLSGDELGTLLGITGQAVYNLESKEGALRVRSGTREAILAIRQLGAREARKRLEDMAKKTTKGKKPASRRRRK
jgi:hypothetical protein